MMGERFAPTSVGLCVAAEFASLEGELATACGAAAGVGIGGDTTLSFAGARDRFEDASDERAGLEDCGPELGRSSATSG
jgi:hypothetical protein